jgi:hypothetical protein
MPVTRLALEQVLVARVGNLSLLAAVPPVPPPDYVPPDLSATGTNPAWTLAIASGLQAAGFPPADPGSATEGDCNAADPARFGLVCDLCEYYGLVAALGSFVRPDEGAQDRRQGWSTVVGAARARRDELLARYASYLVAGAMPTASGTYPANFPTAPYPFPLPWALKHGRVDH